MPGPREEVEDELLARPRSSAASTTNRTQVGRAEGVGRVAHHGRVHPVLGLVDAGRVDERDLGAGPARHAEDALAGRLRLVRDDRDLLADEGVDERRLAGVGPADDGDLADARSVRLSAVPLHRPEARLTAELRLERRALRPARSGRGRRGAGPLPRP